MDASQLPSVSTIAAAGLLFTPALVLLVFQTFRNLRKASNPPFPYPPGPKGELFFGNARQMPEKSQWLAFADWGKKFGKYQSFCTGHLKGSQRLFVRWLRVLPRLQRALSHFERC